jgi:hypothetical protein
MDVALTRPDFPLAQNVCHSEEAPPDSVRLHRRQRATEESTVGMLEAL